MCTVVPDFTFLSKLPFRLHLSFLSKKVALCHLPNTPICFIPLSIPSLPLFDFSIQRIVILSFAMSFFLPTLSVAFTSILGSMEVPAPATGKKTLPIINKWTDVVWSDGHKGTKRVCSCQRCDKESIWVIFCVVSFFCTSCRLIGEL